MNHTQRQSNFVLHFKYIFYENVSNINIIYMISANKDIEVKASSDNIT